MNVFQDNWAVWVLLAIWSVAWKAFALWRAAKLNDKGWFVALIVINTAGLLEIFYLFVFSRRKNEVTKN